MSNSDTKYYSDLYYSDKSSSESSSKCGSKSSDKCRTDSKKSQKHSATNQAGSISDSRNNRKTCDKKTSTPDAH